MAMAIVTADRGRPRRLGLGMIALACAALAGCGHIHRRATREAKAERSGLAAVQTAEVQVALGRSLEADGNHEKALAAYREAARTAPRRPEPQLRAAILLDRLGRFAEAAPHYEAALKLSPADAEIYADRGYSLCLQGRDAEGERVLRQAIAIKPDLARAHNNLGALLGRAGRADEALAEFRKAGCREADGHLNLAFALGEARRWAEARKHIELARDLAPRAPGAGEDASRMASLIARAEAAHPALPGGVAGPASDPAVVVAGGEGPRPRVEPAPAEAPPRGFLARRRAKRRGLQDPPAGSVAE